VLLGLGAMPGVSATYPEFTVAIPSAKDAFSIESTARSHPLIMV